MRQLRIGDLLHGTAACLIPDVVARLTDCCERRIQHFAKADVIKTHDGNILSNGNAPLAKPPVKPNGGHIVFTEYGGEPSGNHAVRQRIPSGGKIVAFYDHVAGHGDPSLLHGPTVAGFALLRTHEPARPGDARDAAMSQLNQMPRGEIAAFAVIQPDGAVRQRR